MSETDPRFATRTQPEAAGLDAHLCHSGGWEALSITDSPQTMELALVNRTPHAVTAGPALLRLSFRPGVLTALEALALAPQSEAEWALSLSMDAIGDTVLEFSGVTTFELAPGATKTVRVNGVSVSAEGGSRATRVELDYRAFFHADGTEVLGNRMLHLSLLRRHAPVGLPATERRSGSSAIAHPFEAAFLSGADLLNDGKSENALTLRILNTTDRPIPLSSDGDAATRFQVRFTTGTVVAEWGLLGSGADHLSVESAPREWQIDHHTVRCIRNTPWAPRDCIDLRLIIHTRALSGTAQLIVSFENLPQHDDGDLVLLCHLGALANREYQLEAVKPLSLQGDQAMVRFDPGHADSGEYFHTATIAASQNAETTGRLDINAPAGVQLNGHLRTSVNHLDITRETFKVGGRKERYYPVAFKDEGWSQGELRIEIFRPWIHHTHRNHGSLMARFKAHSDNWGHGCRYWSADIDQYRYKFVGGATTQRKGKHFIVWLAGNTGYHWTANHAARLHESEKLEIEPAALDWPEISESYDIKTTPDTGFDAMHVSVSRTRDKDTSPVPRGAIIMWSGTASDIPVGWALCDGGGEGENKRPNLIDRFIMGAGRNNANERAEADRHTHNVDPPLTYTSSDGVHRHDFPSGWYKRDFTTPGAFTPGGASGIDTGGVDVLTQSVQNAGDHRHSLDIAAFTSSAQSSSATKNRPRWWALCYIIKL